MSELRDRGAELLAAGAYRKYVQDRYGELREQAAQRFTENGITEQRIYDSNGTYLGVLSVGEPTITVTIADPDAMVDYMFHEHDDELVEVTDYHINPPFWNKIVSASKRAGTGVDPTRDNTPLPWVRVTVTPGDIRVTPSSAARERVKQIVAQLGDLRLELES